MTVPIPECIIGIDILKGLTLQLTDGRYQFGICSLTYSTRSVIIGCIKHEVELPPATSGVQMKQHRIPGGQQEVSDIVQEHLDAKVLISITTEWNNPIWPVKKRDGSWCMPVDYRELSKVTPPLTAAVLDVVTLIEQIQRYPGIWYAVTDSANALFSIHIVKTVQSQFALTWLGRPYTCTRLPQGYIHSPTMCHREVTEMLSSAFVGSSMWLICYIDDILVQGLNQEEVATALQIILETLHEEGWKTDPAKVQEPAQSITFLGIIWNKGQQKILPKAKQNILIFALPQNKKGAQKFIGLFGFGQQHITHLSQILAPLYRVTQKKYQLQ